jgi:phenylpropionate dioxygenase-like ring-hydroxylating dioxygenase large terminal subunit
MFVRNCWYVAGWETKLPAEGMVALTIINEPILLYRTGRGDIVALEDRCCHRQAPLSLGRREGDDVRCG